MTKLYYCTCRCGCTTIIAGKDNDGCTYCMKDKQHLADMKLFCADLEYQFNPFTEVN